MKKMILAALTFLAAIHLIIAQNPAPAAGAGEKAADRIAERVESAETGSSDQKALVKEIAEAARKAGKDNPKDADKVKEAVRRKLDEIRDRKSEAGKPGGKNNKEIEEWVKKLKRDLMDNAYVSLPAPGNTALICTAKGTGRTTGHIADLSLRNPSDQAVSADAGPFLIPSGGGYQPYIVPTVVTVTVPPHSTANIALNGFCADIFSQPVPAGQSMPSFDQWITAHGTQVLSPAWRPEPANGWKPAAGTAALIPVTGAPVGHVIDLNKHPEEAAPLLLEALTQIMAAYDGMKTQGLISTPFSGNPEKERESVIQQTFWIYTSTLAGKEYKRADFSANAAKQYETNTGQKLDDAPASVKQNIDKGAGDFWNTFQAVGAEAKVLAN